MATKPDFAQKLLHDLRLKKERMAVSQNSSNSNLTSRGAYGSPGPAYKGSRQIKALESVGSRSGNSIRKNSNGNRSFHIEDSSNQIVLYGEDRSSRHIGNLSAALAFAFGNGGKFNKMDASGSNPMINFLHEIGRRSMEAGRMEIRSNIGKHSSTTQFPTFSHIHINQISKGVQKLNQILIACSNGLNFDRCSIEVGKELLRGAMDLEESLRMLVNLQEASDHMVNSQRKSKIKLLEEDEDDEIESTNVNDSKQLARPRFSFDKPSKTSHRTKEAAQNGIKKQLMALTYPEETPRLQEKQSRSRSNSNSHTRSASSVPDLKTLSIYLEPKANSISQLKPEKGRISNVIAKLMGLEELPQKEESKASVKEVNSNKKEKKVMVKSQIPAASHSQDTRNGAPVVAKEYVSESNKLPTRDTRFMLEAENNKATSNVRSRVVSSDKNSPWQDSEVAARVNAEPGSKTDTILPGKQQNRISQHEQMPGYRRILQEKETAKDKEKKNSKTGESNKQFLNDVLQKKAPERHIFSEVEDVSEEITEVKRTEFQTGNKNAGGIPISKQHKLQDNYELQQPQMLKKSDHLEEKRRHQHPKQKLQARAPKGNQPESIVTSNPKNSARSLRNKQPSTTLVSATASEKKAMKNTEAKPSKDVCNSRLHEDHTIHPVHVPPQKEKHNYMKIYKSQAHQRVDAVVNRKKGTPDKLARLLNDESPVRQKKKQQKDEKHSSSRGVEQENCTDSGEAKGGITELDKAELNTEPLFGEDLLHDEAELANSGEDDCQSLEVSKFQTCNDKCTKNATEINEVPEGQQHVGRPTVSSDDIQVIAQKALQNRNRGIHEESTETSNVVCEEHKKLPPSWAAELLTESEKHLKEKLIKGQLFLNAAEALFKLNIPVGILHGTEHSGQDAETKLMLECGYELLKKKGRRQEFAVYPCKEMPIGYVKVRSFDDLIKQLSKDFDMLKFYGGKGSEECDTADYLHKMLEKDIQNVPADVSNMWDFGWNEKTFAFLDKDDIVKDLEKHMLNGLLDEITKDLLLVAVSA